MHDPFLHAFSCKDTREESTSTDTWLNRVRENLGQLLIPSHFKPSSANGAPIHLLKFDKSLRPARAQGASLITHAAIFVIVLFLLAHTPGTQTPRYNKDPRFGRLTISAPLFPTLTKEPPSGGSGSGGDENPIPATRGNPPLFSAVVLLKPTLPQNQHPQLPEPPAILDPSAAPIVTPTEKMGLPWMAEDTDSGGPGKGHGIGSKDGNSVG